LGDYRVYTGWEETKVEVNLGDNQEEGETHAESNAAASDSDYSSDSEDDLSPVQRPLYCRDLMRLFHAQENDPDRREKIEVALKETPNVVKERGADGEVAGWGLAREVFNLSNEYDIPDFTALRERCMVAIITEFPRLGCEYFTGEVFGEGRGMGGRWDAVDALCKSAMEVRMGGVCAALVFSALPSLQFLQETHLNLRIILRALPIAACGPPR
jgi:hypothetical protein